MRLDRFREQEERRLSRGITSVDTLGHRTIQERHVFTREQLEQLGFQAAKLFIVGQMYQGKIGAQTAEWQDDKLVVYTEHTPEVG